MSDSIIPTPYIPPSNMQDYWQETIGALYIPVKWNPRWAEHPVRVREVMTRLRAGEPCPEACDVIVGLIHSMCVSETIQRELTATLMEIEENKRAQIAAEHPPTEALFAVCATIENAHEPEQIATANAALADWGISYEQGIDELTRRGAQPTTVGGCETHIDSPIRPVV